MLDRDEIRYAAFAPETLKVDGDIEPRIRKQSICGATVYSADLTIDGRFGPLADIESNQKIIGVDRDKMLLVSAISG